MNLVATLIMVNSVYAYFIISFSMIAISPAERINYGVHLYHIIEVSVIL